jgi:hypothetical protein
MQISNSLRRNYKGIKLKLKPIGWGPIFYGNYIKE